MQRFVVLVDAGYLLSQSINLVSAKKSKRRADLQLLDPTGLIDHLVNAARRALAIPPERELLRIYWYDGVMQTGHSTQQKTLMNVDDVLFRAGTVNGHGQQKGVDSLIVTDLIELAANHAIADAMVVTGDSDLAVGIDLAQRKGVRIAVLGVHDIAHGVAPNQSFEITSRADRVASMGLIDIQRYFAYTPSAAPTAAPTSGAGPSATAARATTASPTGAVSPAAPSAATTPPSPQPQPRLSPPATAAAPVGQPPAPPQTPPAPATGAQAASPVAATKSPQQQSSAHSNAALTGSVKAFIAAHPAVRQTPVTATGIPPATDRLLLHFVYADLGSIRLSDNDRKRARSIFRQEIQGP